MGIHATCCHSGGYLSASRVHCAGREGSGGMDSHARLELVEGGRPGSRPAVTFNLDLVSIGVSNPIISVQLVSIHRDVAPSHHLLVRLRPGATTKASNNLKRPCTQSKYSRLRHTYRQTRIFKSGVIARKLILDNNIYRFIKKSTSTRNLQFT